MATKLVKGNALVNQKVVQPITFGDWESRIVYEHDGTAITSEIIVDGINKESRGFRLAKTPTNTNFNFNGTEPDFELMAAIYGELAEIINSFIKPETVGTE
jgi:hypothetical protein